jgi:hypothetical protein
MLRVVLIVVWEPAFFYSSLFSIPIELFDVGLYYLLSFAKCETDNSHAGPQYSV